MPLSARKPRRSLIPLPVEGEARHSPRPRSSRRGRRRDPSRPPRLRRRSCGRWRSSGPATNRYASAAPGSPENSIRVFSPVPIRQPSSASSCPAPNHSGLATMCPTTIANRPDSRRNRYGRVASHNRGDNSRRTRARRATDDQRHCAGARCPSSRPTGRSGRPAPAVRDFETTARRCSPTPSRPCRGAGGGPLDVVCEGLLDSAEAAAALAGSVSGAPRRDRGW